MVTRIIVFHALGMSRLPHLMLHGASVYTKVIFEDPLHSYLFLRLNLSRLGFEHPTFRMQGERSYRLSHHRSHKQKKKEVKITRLCLVLIETFSAPNQRSCLSFNVVLFDLLINITAYFHVYIWSTFMKPNSLVIFTCFFFCGCGGGWVGKSVCLACGRLGVRFPVATDLSRKTGMRVTGPRRSPLYERMLRVT